MKLLPLTLLLLVSCGSDDPPETCWVKDGREIVEVQCPPDGTGMAIRIDAGAGDQ